MKLGMVGLGRMGSGMTERLRKDGHEVMTYDPQVESTAPSLDELASQLEPPRAVWMMIPAGEITESTTNELLGILESGDVLVDGGNSNFHASQRRAKTAAEKGIHFLDVGVSGGIWGLKEGFCLMTGGADDGVALVQPALETLAPEDGWAHVGPSGAGHFVKMVHNGIEYGLMQAYAEGFEIMRESEFDVDLEQVAGIDLKRDVADQLSGAASLNIALTGAFGARANVRDPAAVKRTLRKLVATLLRFAEKQ